MRGTTGKNGKGKGESEFRKVFPGKDRETIWGDFEIFFREKSGNDIGF